MGQLLSKLEAEAEAVQHVALTRGDEEGYIAHYLQVGLFYSLSSGVNSHKMM
jgi:hypothetical protein